MHYINARIVLTLFVLCLINMLFAGTTGKIVGIVKDKETGAPLIGANVVLVGTNMGASTDADGYYVILNVPPGTYRLDFYYVGYATHSIKNVKVRVDRTTTQHIKMSSKAVEGETVVVQGERPAIEMDRTHSSAVVSSETAELMPVTEVEELIKLQAGVVEVGGQLHFRGGRTREVSYVIDGVPVNNSFSQSGGSLVEVDNNMIAELEVISGTFNAEYGQAQSGVVNIVTKRPASKFSGTLKSYTGDWLSGKNQTFMGINDFDPVGESNIEFSLTGPIFPERLGFVLTGRYRSFENL
nr:TonB-dependent receptor plug domain-containing protein [Candidatus Saccharibacteria bacterium]NIV03891.1 TonB-dependent receptor plug domain-containing protein [Calditrichia bacterium]NIV72222.1 TonB-dependent receptor plug domain-containing protein [Calditrichia bacterium]NIV99169.1 TonB-dependent receptor plug domain-containing protein [Candidatus Saccharibacteria bacterium]NIW79467.1 TonB-dependent receptor plug domain-containing protein [Calditrichia bacterium]